MVNQSHFLQQANELDQEDSLSSFRDKFHIPKNDQGENLIYFCGNSLGLQPKSVRSFIEQELLDWEHLGVEGHTHAKNPWMPYHELLTGHMSEVVGAKPGEVVVMNSLTVNLHLMMVSFYRPDSKRNKILIEKGAFPSDRYAVWSQIKFHGFNPEDCLIEIAPREGSTYVTQNEVLNAIRQHGQELALVMLGNVNYYNGQIFDMKSIVEAGHGVGSIVAFDLAHGAGNLICNLHDTGADFAIWCSYKYLNSGPGGLSGCFVHERHATNFDLPRFAGWWGHDKASRFRMGPDFMPIPGAEGWQLSNPPILPMASLRASLEIFHEAGMSRLREKSEKMSSFLLQYLEDMEGSMIQVITPKSLSERGCQLSIRVHGGDRTLFNTIRQGGVIADWREPDVIRIAPVPLYNTFSELYDFGTLLGKEIEKLNGTYREYQE